MAQDARLGAAVMFVQELDRSVAFYRDVLGLDVADRSTTAALLVAGSGSELILRAMGGNAAHPLGGVGVQYVTWAVAEKADLDQIERALKERQAYRDTRSHEGVVAIEGRDPDDIVVMITYPGADQVPGHRLPARIYGW
jgi:catechol-2,3-dioxygenase